MALKLMTLPLSKLVIDADTQARCRISEETVAAYVAVFEKEDEWVFPAIDVFHDGKQYVVADGFHRYLTAKRVKKKDIECRVHQGTAYDAKIFGMTANDSHGLRMTAEDKRECVVWLLNHLDAPGGKRLTQSDVANMAGVGMRTVQRIASELRPVKMKAPPKAASSPKSSSQSAPVEEPEITPEQKAQQIRNLIGQLIGQLIRAGADLRRVKPNQAKFEAFDKAVRSVKTW